MLKSFEVTNYKNFENTISLDFSNVRDYKFNTECIRNNMVNTGIIYGKNARGKTNLGYALLHIRDMLTDAKLDNKPTLQNCDADLEYTIFKYCFQFDNDKVIYEYKINNQNIIVDEILIINDDEIFQYTSSEKKKIKGDLSKINADTLNWDFTDDMCALKYIINNTPLADDSILKKLMLFVKGMSLVRPELYNRKSSALNQALEYIVNNGLVNDFSGFLNENGVECKLVCKQMPSGEDVICFDYKRPILFIDNASSGTIALTIFYYWYHLNMKTHKFVFLDEFDAFYHHELSEKIIRLMTKMENCQAIFTTHNTSLLTNAMMRPDCLFIITPERITNLPDATDRELREGHNLEKLYRNGEFDE